MSNTSKDGCAIWLSLVIPLVVLFVTIASGHITNSGSQTPASPTSISSEAEEDALIVSISQQETDAPFMLENNQIKYIHSETLGNPCYYEIAGRVLDLEGQPFTNFVVNIKMLDELAPESPGYAFPGEGLAQDGLSGWASVLPQSPVDYEVWLTTEVGGRELSPHIVIHPQGCNYNMAIVNFIQVKPLD